MEQKWTYEHSDETFLFTFVNFSKFAIFLKSSALENLEFSFHSVATNLEF